MTEKQPPKIKSKYSLNQRLWQGTIALSISILICFVIANFYYAHFEQKQESINQYFEDEIKKVDSKIGEIKDLNRFRAEYVNLIHLQSVFRETGEKNSQLLSDLFKALPFEWSIKQMEIARKQIRLTFEVLNTSNLELGIKRLDDQLSQYQVIKKSEDIQIGKNYKEIEIEINLLNESQVNQ